MPNRASDKRGTKIDIATEHALHAHVTTAHAHVTTIHAMSPHFVRMTDHGRYFNLHKYFNHQMNYNEL